MCRVKEEPEPGYHSLVPEIYHPMLYDHAEGT